MPDHRHLELVLARLAGTIAFGLVLGANPAGAQSSTETAITPAPRAQAIAAPRATRPTATPLRSTLTEDDRRLQRGQGRSPALPVEVEAEDDGAPIVPASNSGEGEAETLPSASPSPGRGGEPGSDSAPQSGPVDGLANAADADQVVDGLDPAQVDQRSLDDAAPFAVPPNGFDPDAFALEVEPILDRRPRTLFRFEPFTPRGIRAGSFVILPEVESGGLWSSNVLRSSSQSSRDIAYVSTSTVRIVSDWRRHAVELRARGNVSFFSDLTSENDRAYTLEARGRLDLTRRANVEGLLTRDVTQESRSSVDAVQGRGGRADVTTDTAALAFNQRFNRLSVQLRGAVIDRRFGDVEDGSSGTLTNSSRDYRTTEEAVRATWEFKPTLLAFVEAGFNQRDYERVSSADGILRSSTGGRYRVGVGFGNTSQRLRGEISLGYGAQRPDDRRLSDVSGVLVDASLAYRFSAFTSFLLTARTDVAETTLANSAGALSHSLGVELRHAFRRDLIASASIGQSRLDYSGIRLIDRETTTGLGLEYFQSERVVWFGGWRHVGLRTTDESRNYTADELRIGVRLRQ